MSKYISLDKIRGTCYGCGKTVGMSDNAEWVLVKGIGRLFHSWCKIKKEIPWRSPSGHF